MANEHCVAEADLALTAVPARGRLVETLERGEPYHVVDADGSTVAPITAFLRELQATGRSVATARSYGMDLLRWFRFLWAIDVAWDRATRGQACDYARWLQLAGKPSRVSGRRGGAYSVSVRAHSETVLRGFYDFHRDTGTGPVLNPFPLHRARLRANAHHNPMEPHRNQKAGRYRPTVVSRIPRSIPDGEFNDIFARLPSHRDRALVAFYVSTGARASELLTVRNAGVDPGRQLVTVIRKGSRAEQELPASTDAFVWLRLYQLEMEGLVPDGAGQPLWWTLRRPFRPLTYHGAHRMFERVNQQAGTTATLHSLRHTAAYRMAEDPALPLTDVQSVLGHALLSTTQIYLTPRKEDVIRRLLAHHGEQSRRAAHREAPPAAAGYRSETLDVLFGRTTP